MLWTTMLLVIMLVIFDIFFNFNTKVLKTTDIRSFTFSIAMKKYESIAYTQRQKEQEDQYPQLLQEQQHCLQLLLMLGCMLFITMKLNKQLLRNTYMQSNYFTADLTTA